MEKLARLDRGITFINKMAQIPAETVVTQTARATKQAPGASEIWRNATYPLATVLGTSAIAYGLMPLIRKMKLAGDKKKAWNKLIARHPEFATEAARDQFDALFELSPVSMKHMALAVPMLRRSEEFDTGGVPLDLASTLSSIQGRQQIADPRITNLVSQIAAIAGNASQPMETRTTTTKPEMNLLTRDWLQEELYRNNRRIIQQLQGQQNS